MCTAMGPDIFQPGPCEPVELFASGTAETLPYAPSDRRDYDDVVSKYKFVDLVADLQGEFLQKCTFETRHGVLRMYQDAGELLGRRLVYVYI